LAAGTPIVARDIMRAPAASVGPDTSLGEIARLMSAKRIDTLPVVDEQLEVLGEITSDRLLQLGLPDFFSQLKSVGFIREFDPFEKYFHEEARLRARDVMATKIALLPPETTLIELIFALTVQRHAVVYVAEGRKLVGVVDQSVVLDEVINI
jgi:CBS-domain-containing membrane protein